MGINPCFPDKSDHDFGIADVLSELVEFGIEKTVNNEIIDAVPVVGTVQAFAKIVSSHRAAVMQKQTERFLKELNAQTITQKELQRYRDRVENNLLFPPRRSRQSLIRPIKIIRCGKGDNAGQNLWGIRQGSDQVG